LWEARSRQRRGKARKKISTISLKNKDLRGFAWGSCAAPGAEGVSKIKYFVIYGLKDLLKGA
ncbi:MAG: hypothetical protein LBQ12_02265, partial [Deltaproteobacteria bacterium]|nr:hypothetical protein [Deltaproteobacteria bacterium]